MAGLGTIINAAAIAAGGVLGSFFGRFLTPQSQDTLMKTCGVCVLFLGVNGAMEGFMTVQGSALVSGRTMLVIASLALGALIGELLDIEDWLERFGEWLKERTGSSGDNRFVDGFVTASLTVCIGAMAIIGSIQDGLMGDYSILEAKSVLDLIIIMVMTSSMGKGCAFSLIPVALFQGGVTLLAQFVRPIMTEAALSNLSLVGALLIFCVGVNLVWGKTIRVANLLPSVVVAAAAAFLPA